MSEDRDKDKNRRNQYKSHTLVRVSYLTKARLDKLKVHYRETYDDVIERLLDSE